MKSIWLIGCGNIGFRHLQAMLAATTPAKITVIEPAKALHERIEAELALPRDTAHQVSLRPDLPEAGPVDLAVVATSAPPRAGIVRALASGAKPPHVILEKVLAQTDAELAAMAADLAAIGATTHVNCPRRYFPGYQALKERLAGQRPVSLTVTGSQFGLGSNAVHFIDLAECLNDSPLAALDPGGLEPGGQPSKRAGFQEIYGTLTGRLQNGATLSVTCENGETVGLTLSVTTADGQRHEISEATGKLRTPEGAEEDFPVRFVSQTPEIYIDAIAGACKLVTLADSLNQHRHYLAALRQHFGLADDQPVPVS